LVNLSALLRISGTSRVLTQLLREEEEKEEEEEEEEEEVPTKKSI